MSSSYQTAAEMTTQLATIAASADPVRSHFESLTDDDKLVWGVHATEAIDACRWLGNAYEIDQEHAWPRVWPKSAAHSGDSYYDRRYGAIIDPDESDDGDESVANLPRRLKQAHALQAAHMAYEASGGGLGRRLEEAASRGVTGHSAMGESESIDGSVARRCWARLHPDVQRLLGKYKAAAVEVF